MSAFDRFGRPSSSVLCAGEAPERDDPSAAVRRQWREAAEEMDRRISPLQTQDPIAGERALLESVALLSASYVRSDGGARVDAVHALCVALAELRAMRGGDERLRTEPLERGDL